MIQVYDSSLKTLVGVTEEGIRRMFIPLFTDQVAGLSLPAFGISSVVYFDESIQDIVSSSANGVVGLTYKDVKKGVIGIISSAGGGLTVSAPVWGADGRMRATLTCVLGSLFHSVLYNSGKSLYGCGIVLGGERSYSSNIQPGIVLGTDKGTEVLFAYEGFDEPLAWAAEAYGGTYVHSFEITLGECELLG